MWFWQLRGLPFLQPVTHLSATAGHLPTSASLLGWKHITDLRRLAVSELYRVAHFLPTKGEIELQRCDPGNRSASDVG